MRRRRDDLRIQFDPERVGEADEVVEDTDHMGRHDDRFLAPSVASKRFDVAVGDLVRRDGQLLGELEERAVAGLDRRRAEVRLDPLDELGVDPFETEKLSVDLCSIPAAARPRRDHRDHLALLAGEWPLVPHDRLEQLEEGTAVARPRRDQAAHLRRELRVGVREANVARRRELGGMGHRLFDRIDPHASHRPTIGEN